MHPDKAHTHALTYQVRFLIKYVSVTHIPLKYFMDQRKTDSERQENDLSLRPIRAFRMKNISWFKY